MGEPGVGFLAWLRGALDSVEQGAASDVPCGGCTACCRSSQFIAVGPEERDALAHIPPALLFPSPGRPEGHRIMGYDDHGRCPMLVDDACSIYAHRPEACRTYDCRIFTATGLWPDASRPDRADLADRARSWRFDLEADRDRIEHQAVRAAAAYVQAHADELARVAPTTTETQQAVLALEVHTAFVGRGADDPPTPHEVEVVLHHRGPQGQE